MNQNRCTVRLKFFQVFCPHNQSHRSACLCYNLILMCLVVEFWSPTNVSEQSTEARTAPDAKRLQLQRFQRIFPCTTICFWFQQQNDHVTWLTGACLISWRAHFNRALLKIRLVSPWNSFLVPVYVQRKLNRWREHVLLLNTRGQYLSSQ